PRGRRQPVPHARTAFRRPAAGGFHSAEDRPMTALLTLWVSGLAIAGFGAWVLFDASLGLNWALWMLLAAAGLALCCGVAERRPPAAIWAPLGLACALAAGAPLTADRVFDVLIVMGGLLLLSAAMLVARHPVTRRLH